MANRSFAITQQLRWSRTRSSPFGGDEGQNGSFVVTRSWTNFLNGSEDPEWKRKVQQNVDATGQLIAEQSTMMYQGVDVTNTWFHPNSGIPYIDNVKGPVNSGDVSEYTWNAGDWLDVFTTADNRALVKLHRAIQEETTRFKGQVFLGELRETIRMIRRPVAALRSGLEKFCKTVVERAKRMPRKGRSRVHWTADLNRMIGGTWLEYSFGWVPFMNDVKDLASVFANDNDERRRSKARGMGYAEKADHFDLGTVWYGANTPFLNWKVNVKRCRVVYRAGLAWDAAAPFGTFQRTRELAGFRLREFIPTMWELLPYSWIVDYFTNIGELLECTATDTSSIRWVTRTALYEHIQQAHTKVDRANAGWPGMSNKSSISGVDLGYAQMYFKRVSRITASLLYPTVQFRMPPLESAKWLNLAGLHLVGKGAQQELQGLLRHG